jgi:hypothetical protein
MSTPTSQPRWALVTGASAGIGEAFARELAARGWSLVLTARRLDRLEGLAGQLRDGHGIATHCIAADLADPASPARIHASTQAQGIVVEMLVNNAGYGVPGTLISQPWERHRDFLRVLVDAMVELCWRYLPAMREQRRGRIINVASLAGHVPGSAGHTLYAAAKAFAIRFSQSLALESRGRNVHVTALCPGFTYSEFHDVTGSRAIVSKMPGFMWMQAAEVARQGLDAVERGDVVYVNGRVNRLMKFLAKHLPDRWALRLVQRQSRNFRVADEPAGQQEP